MNGRDHQPFEAVEQWLERHYARVGARLMTEIVVVGVLWVMLVFVLGVAGLVWYLEGSTADFWALLGLAMGLTWILGPAGYWWWRRGATTLLGWMRGQRSRDAAQDAWAKALAAPLEILVTVYAFALPGHVGYSLYAADRLGRGLDVALMILVAVTMLTVIGAMGIAVFFGQLTLRPVLREIVPYLPPDFEPGRSRYGLAQQLMLRLVVLGLAMAFLGGLVAVISDDPETRLTLSFTLTPAALAVLAALVVPPAALSLVSPVNALIEATRRARQGDLTAAVPVITADELGELSHSFNAMIADLRRTTGELRESRSRIVAASDAARRRVERDLHDGAQQDLVLTNLKLGLLERKLREDPAAAEELVAEIRADLERGLTQLRDLAHGIYPAVIESDGLPAALREAAGRMPIPTDVDCGGTGRFDREIEAAVYFCCLEALQNASKHAGKGARGTVRCRSEDGNLHFEVADDGVGFDADGPPSGGLLNMADRIGALGGELEVDAAPGRGTTVRGRVPVA